MIERLPPPRPCAATAGVYEDVTASAEIDGLGNMQGTAEAGGVGGGVGVIHTATHKQIKKAKIIRV